MASDLNDRQLLYLKAAYQLDQQQEEANRFNYRNGIMLPAAEWRLMPYGRWNHERGRPVTPLRKLIEAAAAGGKRLIDPGAGSTWKALAERGLVEIEVRVIIDDPHPRIGYSLPHIRLTRSGRALVRTLTGQKRPVITPKPKPVQPEGQLPVALWKVLAHLYEYERIQDTSYLITYDPQRNSFQQLQKKELIVGLPACQWPAEYQITEQGRTYYERYYRVNSETYRQIHAVLPHPHLTEAQYAFWQQVHELNVRIRTAGINDAARLTARRERYELRLQQTITALFVAPYWYPALQGRPVVTTLNAAEAYKCDSELEALAKGKDVQQDWKRQLDELNASWHLYGL